MTRPTSGVDAFVLASAYRAAGVPVPADIADATIDAPPPEPPSLPSLASRAWHFATSLAAHAADGFAKRSEAEIEAILTTHCQPCGKFDGAHCTVCGCNCSGNREFVNKIAWASEHCPHPDGAKW